jgi:hypothetical protein
VFGDGKSLDGQNWISSQAVSMMLWKMTEVYKITIISIRLDAYVISI